MGNAGGKEGENQSNGPTARSDGDSMGNSPPESPDRSMSPLSFTPQVPLSPIQRSADSPPVYDDSMMNDGPSHLEKGIPTLITWSQGGNDVAVEGSWDNWTSRKVLQRTGKDHSILLVLPFGIYHYNFIVDGERRYIPDLPFDTDEMGQNINLLDVNDYIPENLDGVSEFEPPPSPESSYSQPFPAEDDYAKDPPLIPSQLHDAVVLDKGNSEEASSKPEHVVLNHLYIEKGLASESLVALGLTQRFRSKFVTVVLYKSSRR